MSIPVQSHKYFQCKISFGDKLSSNDMKKKSLLQEKATSQVLHKSKSKSTEVFFFFFFFFFDDMESIISLKLMLFCILPHRLTCHKMFRSHPYFVPSRTACCMLTACAAHSRRGVQTLLSTSWSLHPHWWRKFQLLEIPVVPGFFHQMLRCGVVLTPT